MKVFISWSGDRSQALASALREWLPLILHYAEPWLSQADIEAGERWGVEVAKELDESSFGITCVTAENVASPWLLFEAGALAKSMQEGRVVPLLLDMDFQDISGPMAQFQAKKVEKKGIFEILVSINKINSEQIPEPRLNQLFEALWPQLEAKLTDLPKAASTGKKVRSQGEILEELVTSVRNLDLKLREENDEPYSRRSRRNRDRMMMMEEMSHRLAFENDPSTSLMIAASFIRDSHPWIYELAGELGRAVKAKNVRKALQIREMMERSLEMSRSMSDEYDYRAVHMVMREIMRSLDQLAVRAGGPSRIKAPPKKDAQRAAE